MKLKKLTTAKDLLDKEFGKEGTGKRKTFNYYHY